MKRLRCHNRDTGYGKAFVAFLSQIVRSYMLKQLRPMMQEKTDKTPLEEGEKCLNVSKYFVQQREAMAYNLPKLHHKIQTDRLGSHLVVPTAA